MDYAGVVMEKIPRPLRKGQPPLPHRDLGKDVIDEVCGGLGHAAGAAGRIDAPHFDEQHHANASAAAHAPALLQMQRSLHVILPATSSVCVITKPAAE